MIPPLDVFAFIKNDPVWLCSTETLVGALEIARHRGTGRYFVFSHETGHKTLYVVDPDGAIKPVTSFGNEHTESTLLSNRPPATYQLAPSYPFQNPPATFCRSCFRQSL